jgi:RNA polymerase sigma-70 factor (ECF subfamily)
MAAAPPMTSSDPRTPPAADGTRELFRRFSRGERDLLGPLLERHLAALRVFVRLQTGPLLRQRESCSDLVQSVCRELLENAAHFEYRGEDEFKHWLFVAALNKIRQHHRYHAADRRAPAREAEDGDARLGELYASLVSPSQQAIARETVQRLERAFDDLPEDYRDVILLCRVVGLPQETVAQRMGRSVDSVRNLLHRALARLAGLADGS